MKKLMRFMLGFVRIRVTGVFPERFLNLCGTERLSFWEPERPDERTLIVTIPLMEQKRSKVLAEKAFCETEILRKSGFPFFLRNFRRRYALLGGMLLAVAGAMILSGFILVVDVTGNSAVSDSVILTELERIGFGVGSYGPAVNVRALSNRMLLELPELSFLTINISGVRAEVVVRESAEIPELEDWRQSADVTAKADGLILDIDPLIGRPMVMEGEAVLKGEVLISGLEEHHTGDGSGQVIGLTQVRAEGRVMAQTRRVLRASTPLSVTSKGQPVSSRTLWTINFFKNSIKFGSDGSIPAGVCDKIKIEYPLNLPGGVSLPLSLSRTVVTVYESVEREAERGSAEDFLRETLERRLSVMLGEEGQLLHRKTTFSERDGVLTAELEAACIEQIGVESVELAE